MFYTKKTAMLVGRQAHIGRDLNCDAHAVVSCRLAGRGQATVTLAVVARGMYGYPPGKGVNSAASRIVVDSVAEVANRPTHSKPCSLLSEAIATASKRLSQYRESHPEIRSMLASCAAAVVVEDRLYTASIGNCRIYLFRRERLQQISTDHTMIQKLIDEGYVRKEELEGRPGWSGFPYTRCLGMGLEPPSPYILEIPDFRLRLDPDPGYFGLRPKLNHMVARIVANRSVAGPFEHGVSNQGLRLKEDDRVLLCTAGFYGSARSPAIVKDDQIREVLLKQSDPQEAADELVTLARKSIDERWDMTVVVLKETVESQL